MVVARFVAVIIVIGMISRALHGSALCKNDTAQTVEKRVLAQSDIRIKQIPVLCYHNIRHSVAGHEPAYTISVHAFEQHMKMLSDSGYTTILPDQLVRYLTVGTIMPKNPIVITFDDAREEQFSLASKILDNSGFKGVFFILTTVIGKRGYMTSGQIKKLSDNGHVIGCHTYDHPDLRKLKGYEWTAQLDQSKSRLQQITGTPVLYFAYPYGLWNDSVISELKKHHIIASFQLSGNQSVKEPLYTIRRLMVAGNWTKETLYRNIHRMFR